MFWTIQKFRDKKATPCDHASSCRGIIPSNRMNRWSKSDVFSRVGGSHVLLASCFLNLVTFWQHRPDQPQSGSREPSPRTSSHTWTSPFHRTPREKQARRTTWGPSFWQTIMWTILGLVVLQFLRVEISNPEPQIGLKEVLTPGTLTVWHVTDQWIS